jgi:hypothetical protein
VLDPLPAAVVLLVPLPAAPVLAPADEDVVLDEAPEVVDVIVALLELPPAEPVLPPPVVDSPHAKSQRPVHQAERTKANLRMGASGRDLRRKRHRPAYPFHGNLSLQSHDIFTVRELAHLGAWQRQR